jgi:hypothetical protein
MPLNRVTSQRTLSPTGDLYRLGVKTMPSLVPVSAGLVTVGPSQKQGLISIPRFLLVLGFVAIAYVAANYDTTLREPQLRASVLFHEYRSAHNQKVTPPLEPLGAVISGMEMFYMLPAANATASGLLIFFHGCNHAGEDMFRLPEHRIVAVTALRRGLAVLALTSSDRETGCWSEYDVVRLQETNIVDEWMKTISLPTDLPRIGMGTSSGASILFSVYKVLGFHALASYVMPDGFATQAMIKETNDASNLPATVFVHMPKDKLTSSGVTRQASALRSLGVPTKVYDVRPHPFTPELCDRRLPEVGDRRCHNFLARVHARYPGLLDKANNVLQPFVAGDWQTVFQDSKLDDDLRHFVGAPPAEKGQLSPLQFSGHSWSWAAMVEEVSVSYGEHEMTCEHRNEVFDFLMKNAGIEFEADIDQRQGLLGIISQSVSKFSILL